MFCDNEVKKKRGIYRRKRRRKFFTFQTNFVKMSRIFFLEEQMGSDLYINTLQLNPF